MTISSTTNKSGPYIENGVTTEFEYAFKIDDETHIQVVRAAGGVETILALGTHYTVTGVGNDKGNIVLVTPGNGSTLTLVRDAPFTQELDLENQGAYFAEQVEAALDLAVARDQQLAEKISRAVVVPISADATDLETLIGGVVQLLDSVDAVVTVAAISTQVVAVAANEVAVSTVAANIVGVQTTADNIAAILAAPGHASAAVAAAGAAAAAAADTAADRVATGQDKAATAADRVATGQDKVATAADRVQTGQDRVATAADRVQTGADRAAAAASAEGVGGLTSLIPQAGPRGGPMSLLNARDVFLGDDAMLVVNQQELAAWYKGLRDSALVFNASGNAGTLGKAHVFVTGDSKPSYSDPTNTIIQDYADWVGMGQVLTFNYSMGGQNTYWLNNTGAPLVMGSGAWSRCNLIVIDIGTNERVASADGGAQTAAQTESNLMSYIANLRNVANGGRSPDQLSIVIMGQTPGNTGAPNLQNEVLMRELDTIYRRVAKATNSVFVDQRGQFPRPHYDAGWMDDLYLVNPSYGHTSVHPMETGSVVRQQVLLNVLFPEAAIMRWNVPVFQSLILDAGWTSYTAGQSPRAFKRRGWISWEGLIQKGTAAAGTQVGHLAAVAGWAPKTNKFSICQSSASTSGNFYIHNTGTVVLQSDWSTREYLGFDGISYRATGPAMA